MEKLCNAKHVEEEELECKMFKLWEDLICKCKFNVTNAMEKDKHMLVIAHIVVEKKVVGDNKVLEVEVERGMPDGK